MKLLITTQVYENYGYRWKAKGGNDYVVLNVDPCDMIDVIIDRARCQIEQDNDSFQETIIGHSLVSDDYLTEFERSQLDYEGKITYPAQEIELDDPVYYGA
jgi:hypothetical protein